MLRTTFALLLLSLSAPSLGQEVNPALEGSGSQTQSLDLAKKALSVSIDSGGALSLGRGDDQAEGHLGISVNDRSLRIGNAPDDSADATARSSQSGQQRPATPADSAAQLASAGAESNHTECAPELASPESLALALREHYRVELRETDCTEPASGLAALQARSSEFFTALWATGAPASDMVSITIDNDAVILHYADSDSNH